MHVSRGGDRIGEFPVGQVNMYDKLGVKLCVHHPFTTSLLDVQILQGPTDISVNT